MKKMKFNLIERTAGLFVLFAACGSVVLAISILVQKGFFDSKVHFATLLDSSESVRVGTPVRMAGLKAGSVDTIEMDSQGRVKVGFFVFARYAEKLRADSRVNFVRPSILTEKQFELAPGSEDQARIAPESLIPAQNHPDLMDALSGKQIAEIVTNVDHIAAGLAALLGQSGNQKNAGRIIANVGDLTGQLRKAVTEFTAQSPHFARDIAQTLTSLSSLSGELAKVAPLISASADGIPQSTKKLVELINESVTLIKAMQKSFLLRGSVQEVREEDASRSKASIPDAMDGKTSPK